MKTTQNNQYPWYWHACGGFSAGIASVILLYPLDFVKTRFQVKDWLTNNARTTSSFSDNYASIREAIRTIYRKEGARGFYQGLPTNIIGSGVAWAMYFAIFNRCQLYFQSSRESSPAWANLSCGFLAGFATVLATNPIWVIKTRIQVQQNSKSGYSGFLHGLRSLWREEGLKGYSRGIIPGLWGTSHGALQFMSYEEIVKFLRFMHAGSHDHITSWEFFLAGGMSKLCASSITYPFQVVRSRSQLRQEQLPLVRSVKTMFAQEGFRGFYRGWSLTLIRTVPSAAITFVTYENVVRLFKHFDHR